MTAEVRREGGVWTVRAHGQRLLDRDDQAVAQRIVEAIQDPTAHPGSESRVVADSILGWLRTWRTGPG